MESSQLCEITLLVRIESCYPMENTLPNTDIRSPFMKKISNSLRRRRVFQTSFISMFGCLKLLFFSFFPAISTADSRKKQPNDWRLLIFASKNEILSRARKSEPRPSSPRRRRRGPCGDGRPSRRRSSPGTLPRPPSHPTRTASSSSACCTRRPLRWHLLSSFSF